MMAARFHIHPMSTYGETTYYRHFFWNSSWQTLEMRSTTTANAQPESLSAGIQYVWSARYIDALVVRDRPSNGERFYHLSDANFNVTTLLDTSGDAVEHYQYDPYGKVTILNGGAPDTDGAEWTADPNNSSDVSNEYFYTGRKRDHKTFFYNNRERYYHAELARFTGRDPIGYGAGDVNLYAYVGGNPIVRVDPSGLIRCKRPCVLQRDSEGARAHCVQAPPGGKWTNKNIVLCAGSCGRCNRFGKSCRNCCGVCGQKHKKICMALKT